MELKRLGDMWCDIDSLLEEDLQNTDTKMSFGGVFAAGFRVRPGLYYAASCAFALMLATPIFVNLLPSQTQPQIEAPTELVYETLHGESKKVTLKDGSVVHLNTGTAISVAYSNTSRDVNLLRGEALFEVESDPARPFTVFAEGVTAKAVGTSFCVRLKEEGAKVMVAEGLVEVKPTPPPAAKEALIVEATLLQTGEIADLSLNEGEANLIVTALAEDKMSNKLAWRDGFIVFEGDPLSIAVEEVSRYTPSKVIISDPSLRTLPIGGVFPAGEIDSFIGALRTSFGVKAEFVEDELIYLSKASE
jgi:transmembrane sensor